MSIPVIVEVAIGLVVVYYLFGLVVNFFASQVKTALEMKGKDLYKVLKDALGDQLGEVLDQDLIKELAPYRHAPLTNLVRRLRKETGDYVEKMPVPTLASQVLKKYQEVTGDDTTAADAKAAAIGTLIDPAFDKLKEISQGEEGKLLSLEQNAQRKLEGWLDGVMAKASDLYSKNVRTVVIILALIVTVAFNVDTIAIGQHFYASPAAREQAVRTMDKIFEEAELDPDTGKVIVPENYQAQLDQVSALDIPWGWGASAPEGNLGLRLLGLLITWVALAQGSSFWYDALKKLKGVRTKVKSTDDESGA